MDGLTFDIAHMLAGMMVLVSFLLLYQDRMFGLLNRGGASTLPLSRFHFGGLGTKMMQKVMTQNRMPGVPELMQTALDLGVRFIACTTTMGLMGITKDTLIDGIDQFAGVTTYLAEAKHGSVNLFI